MEKSNKLKLIINIALAALFLAGVVFVTIKYGPYLTRLASEPQQLKDALNSFGWKGVLVFILLQIIQVVVAAIPGELVQLAGGYLYGSWLGTLYSLTGIVTGSVIVFFTARFLGYPIISAFVSQKNLDKFNFMMNSNKSEVAMFLLFLIPGIPKDILTYIAGLTPIKPLRFFMIITIGRLPALFGSSVIGSSTQKGDYLLVVILSAAALVLFTAGLLLKDKIIEKLHEVTQNRENKKDS